MNEYEILSATLPDFLKLARPDIDYIRIPIDENVSIYQVTEEWLQGYSLRTLGYRAIPKLYVTQAVPDSLEEQNAVGMENAAFRLLLQEVGIRETLNPPLSLTGEGVLIGIVDTGIRAENPVFFNSYGQSKVVAYWNQADTTGPAPGQELMGTVTYGTDIGINSREERPADEQGTMEQRPPEPGSRLEQESIPMTREDPSGHGTALASIISMAVPLAELAVVGLREASEELKAYYGVDAQKECYAETDIMLGIQFLVQEAMRRDQPLVIVLGLGTSYGDHAGNGYLCEYLNRLGSRSNIAIISVAGNESASAHHSSVITLGQEGELSVELGDIISPSEELFRASREVEILVGDNSGNFMMECWFEATSQLSFSIRTPGGETVDNIDVRTGVEITPRFIFDSTNLTIYPVLIEQGSGKNLIVFRFETPTPGVWRLRITASSMLDGVAIQNIQLWLPMDGLLRGKCVFLKPTPTMTVTDPGNTHRVITIGAYDANTGSIGAFSGRGLTAIGALKPDLAAPGVNVPTVLGSYTGTGTAAAITASAVALFMEWALVRNNIPYVNSETIKRYLALGAEREPGINYPNIVWGYGKLNLEQIFERMIG